MAVPRHGASAVARVSDPCSEAPSTEPPPEHTHPTRVEVDNRNPRLRKVAAKVRKGRKEM